MPALLSSAQSGGLARICEQPAAAALCLPTIITVLDRAATDAAQKHTAGLSNMLCEVLVPVFEHLATRRQAVEQLLPLLRKWLSNREARKHEAACAAAMQPAVLLAARKAVGLRDYVSALHPMLMDCALARPEEDSMEVDAGQVSCTPGVSYLPGRSNARWHEYGHVMWRRGVIH